jgi:hypothetical protein
MVAWSYVRLVLRLSLAAAAIYMGWVFLDRYWSHRKWNAAADEEQAKRNAAFSRTYGGTAVKILQFYAREGNLAQGSPTVICYGVLNARSLRIEPPVEGVSPALSRCVEVSPLKDTQYTLTAEGNDGGTVSESFVLKVSPDQASLPRVSYFKVAERKAEGPRQIFTLTFGVVNGDEVSIEPPVFPTLHGAPNGKFFVSPEKTTTYTLIVKGKFGHSARRALTVEVPGG